MLVREISVGLVAVKKQRTHIIREIKKTMNRIGDFVKEKRKEAGLTQEEFAIRSGLGLRFVRELEQGKETVRMDKVNQALAMFGMEVAPARKETE